MKTPLNPLRRRALQNSSLVAVTVAASATAQAQAQPVTLRFQSTFPGSDLLHKFAESFAKRVNDMGEGRVKVEMLPVGAVAKVAEVLDFVSSGKLDGGLGYPAYWFDRAPAIGLWDAGAAYGMDSRHMLAWHEHGGGRELLAKIYAGIGAQVESILCIALPTQPLGWFKKPIESPDDFKGLKYRTVGLALEVFKILGAVTKPMPAAAIKESLQKGVIDGAEWNNLTSDETLGLHEAAKFCMLQSFHEATALLEILVSSKRWQTLTPDVREILRIATHSMSQDAYRQMAVSNAKSMVQLREKGAVFARTSEVILQAQLRAWDRVIAARSFNDALFAQVANSQRAYARQMTRWAFDVPVDYKLANQHYFASQRAA